MGTKGTKASAPLPVAALTALGVVYGDLGTSPLYAMQAVMQALGRPPGPDAALGVLSLLFWTLIIVISVKYAVFVLRADNHGEGGVLALMSLVGANAWKRGCYLLASLGVLGAALVYGDGVITPAISVLSAVEGVNVATHALRPYVLPIALGILIALFLVQRLGTAKIGGAFGPVMLAWFVVIGAFGAIGVARHPGVLAAIDPWFGIRLLVRSGPTAWLILGGVFLCATGGEALYADLGHVGRLPIRLAWYLIVLPALLLNYAGQTASLVAGDAAANPFWSLPPSWALYPTVALATVATVIASQAIITGAFSMTRQAIQLGWLPLLEIRQTSERSYGQIYAPTVNWLMMAATVAITFAFRSSDRLAGAYGTAVSTTMLMTSLLLVRAMTRVWRWPLIATILIAGVFLIVDGAFFSANLLKFLDGGWIPLTIGAVLFFVMATWRSGIQAIRSHAEDRARPFDAFIDDARAKAVVRTPGASVFLTRIADQVPPSLVEYLRISGSLHETVVTLLIVFEETPRVPPGQRGSFAHVSDGFWKVRLRYGFMEIPDLPGGLASLKGFGEALDLRTAVFIGMRNFVARDAEHPSMSRWRTSLFAFLYRNGQRVTDHFRLPPEQVVEIAREIAI